MQVNSTSYVNTATQALKTGNDLPPNKAIDSQPTQDQPSIRALAKTIDPSNMSRNDARAIAEAQARAGELTIDNAFFTQSAAFINENGYLRVANETDAIMNEKFNMFDELKGAIEFNKSIGLPIGYLEDGLKFLEKFITLAENPEVDVYT